MRAFFLLWLLAVPSFSQINPVISPEVLPDKRVIFRVAATNAHEVAIFVDYMRTGTQEKMKKADSGVWSVTLGPVKPGIYIYYFVIDGLSIADPVNPKIKLRARTSASLLEVASDSASFWEARNVPHGTVGKEFHKATTLGGETREVWVYTPPGYEKNSRKRYPVLYLLHGSNDTPAGWSTVGMANFTLDNLLAERKAREMILVTPFGHAVPFGAPRAMQQTNTERFEEYLLKDVIPMIEGKYRVARGRQNRAIAGFSMGGGQALHIGLGHLDLFGAVVALSTGVPRNFEERFSAVLASAGSTNKKLKLFWIACGRDDAAFQSFQNLSGILTKHGIEHIHRETEGAHTFNVWRENFGEFAPLLFQWNR